MCPGSNPMHSILFLCPPAGVLALLQEAGESQATVSAGERWLEAYRRDKRAGDAALAVALARCDLARDALEGQGDVVQVRARFLSGSASLWIWCPLGWRLFGISSRDGSLLGWRLSGRSLVGGCRELGSRETLPALVPRTRRLQEAQGGGAGLASGTRMRTVVDSPPIPAGLPAADRCPCCARCAAGHGAHGGRAGPAAPAPPRWRQRSTHSGGGGSSEGDAATAGPGPAGVAP